MYPNLTFKGNPTIIEYLSRMWTFLSSDEQLAKFNIARTHTEHFIPRMCSLNESYSATESVTFCFADEIGEPTRDSIRNIYGRFTSEKGDYVAFWNHNTSKWMAYPSTARMSIVYLYPETDVSVWSKPKEGRVVCEKFTAGPIFLEPETGAPSRYYYPKQDKTTPDQPLNSKDVQIAVWMHHSDLHTCGWTIKEQQSD
ncbi:MAG: hypothetical protein QG568_470 [Patescibacteria group bacterium]|nr:hypothetical protein [Patescibacteria group bacterium]